MKLVDHKREKWIKKRDAVQRWRASCRLTALIDKVANIALTCCAPTLLVYSINSTVPTSHSIFNTSLQRLFWYSDSEDPSIFAIWYLSSFFVLSGSSGTVALKIHLLYGFVDNVRLQRLFWYGDSEDPSISALCYLSSFSVLSGSSGTVALKIHLLYGICRQCSTSAALLIRGSEDPSALCYMSTMFVFSDSAGTVALKNHQPYGICRQRSTSVVLLARGSEDPSALCYMSTMFVFSDSAGTVALKNHQPYGICRQRSTSVVLLARNVYVSEAECPSLGRGGGRGGVSGGGGDCIDRTLRSPDSRMPLMEDHKCGYLTTSYFLFYVNL
ncbi:hypothetical protein J6590_024551 [Homalodisca vitripennis]|nr:hypothetical protein J6590_024551 [Homalodisca vitripennis]